MSSGGYRFDHFVLDPGERALSRDGEPLDLNARYFDALLLLVREHGRLVSKERFLEEVWRGVPVTDEALTQCIRTLRRRLGDDAVRPRFIETVSRHGYRFIAPVEAAGADQAAATGQPSATPRSHRILRQAVAGGLGGGAAGALVGLLYGLGGAVGPSDAGALSGLLVLISICVLAATLAAIGISLGVAVATSAGRWPWPVAGGALGGLLLGGIAKLLGVDAFALLLGRSPGDITGAIEGAVMGAAVGLGFWLASRPRLSLSPLSGALVAGLISGAAGSIIPLLGGRLMGGSLDLLIIRFPQARLRLDPIGGLFGEDGFGRVSQSVTGGLEGFLFGACVVAALIWATRRDEP